jgi:hypothetical protein
MSTPDRLRRRQKSVVLVGILMFQLLLIFLQIWLFVMVLENMLAGRAGMAIPAAAVSCVVMMINIWMLRGLYALTSRN